MLPGGPPRRDRLRDGRVGLLVTAVLTSIALQGLWLVALSTTGGDEAAQYAWARFARSFPGSAYDFAWYGGMHPISYSLLSPYVMAALGVRPTMVVAGVACGALLALLVAREGRRGWSGYAPTLAGVAAFFGNAVSGRVTFALGTAFGLAALCLLLGLRQGTSRRPWLVAGRTGVAVLALLATAASPVSGLFLGIVAAAVWLRGRRLEGYLLGVPPILVVAGSAVVFPFSGVQPMSWSSALLPAAMGVAVAVLVPARWREVRLAALVYVALVVGVWVVPTPIGTNVSRLGLLFGGVVLAAVTVQGDRTSSLVSRRWGIRVGTTALTAAVLTSLTWQVVLAAQDVRHSRPPSTLVSGLAPVLDQLRDRRADLARVEVVPMRSHAEAAAFAPHVSLARGWNRQADVARNPIFYTDGALTPDSYRAWLHRWAVRFVVLPDAEPDPAASAEAQLVGSDPSYLTEVWHDENWRLYRVRHAVPLAARPATVTALDPAELDVSVPRSGSYVVRVAWSPWLTLLGDRSTACVRPARTSIGSAPSWVVLEAPAAGVYRLAAPYRVSRGGACS